MSRAYLPFIDSMKAAGIFVIVMGHVAGAPTDFLTPPIYPKQLGVAFFMFVMGFSLARDIRPRWQVLFNRLFEIFLFGIAIALLISTIKYPTVGTLNLSNYLPFLLGANVLLDHFPANPTTWYIGTYFHVLLLWAFVVRPVRVRSWMLAASAIGEITVRALLLATTGEYIAYMVVPNWMTVFLLGTWFGQRADLATPGTAKTERLAFHRGAAARFVLLTAFAVAWALAVRPLVQESSFPFMRLSSSGPFTDALVTSSAVSAVYLAYTCLVFQVVRRLAAPPWVRFIARNTLIVFIAHMPVFYALSELMRGTTLPLAAVAIMRIGICLFVLAAVSEAVRRLLRPGRARAWLWTKLAPQVSAEEAR